MRHGFIREQKDIKYLILFSMSFLPFAIGESDLLDIVLIDDAFGYFEFSEAFADLIAQKYVAKVMIGGQAQFLLTPAGATFLPIIRDDLPASVRDKAEAAAIRVVRAIRRDATIKTKHTANEDGSFTVELAIHDKTSRLIGIEMLVFTKRQCAMLEDNFRKNAERLYKEMVNLLLSEGPVE